jgi:ribosome maturation factor RimP
MSGMMISTHFIEVKMNLEKMKEKLIPILNRYDLKIYSIRKKKEFGENIVEILIDVEVMDIDTLEKIHLEYIDLLTDDELDPNYFLELSSVGVERPIKIKEEVINYLSRYVYLESPKYKGYGTLLAFEDNTMTLEINDKGRLKKINILFDEAKKLRTAIKF